MAISTGPVGFLGDLLKLSRTFEWTSTNETEMTDAETESASVTIGGPSYNYAGPTDILVYWDTVYHSFMFAFPSEAAPSPRRRAVPRKRPALA